MGLPSWRPLFFDWFKKTKETGKKRFHENKTIFSLFGLYNHFVVEVTIRIITQIGGKSLRCGP